MSEINWRNIGKGILSFAIDVVRHEVHSAAEDMSELKQVGQRLGIPYVPGEDINEYRKRVVAARDHANR